MITVSLAVAVCDNCFTGGGCLITVSLAVAVSI